MLSIKGHCRILWFDSGGALELFRLSEVCRLMVTIFTGCILHFVFINGYSSFYYGYVAMFSGKKVCVLD